MAYIAKHRYARIAPRKARLATDLIRGMRIDQALMQLEMNKKRSAYFVRGVLQSAIANAEEQEADVSRRGFRVAAYLLLHVSLLSVGFALSGNMFSGRAGPWGFSWLHLAMRSVGWVDY